MGGKGGSGPTVMGGYEDPEYTRFVEQERARAAAPAPDDLAATVSSAFPDQPYAVSGDKAVVGAPSQPGNEAFVEMDGRRVTGAGTERMRTLLAGKSPEARMAALRELVEAGPEASAQRGIDLQQILSEFGQ